MVLNWDRAIGTAQLGPRTCLQIMRVVIKAGNQLYTVLDSRTVLRETKTNTLALTITFTLGYTNTLTPALTHTIIKFCYNIVLS